MSSIGQHHFPWRPFRRQDASSAMDVEAEICSMVDDLRAYEGTG